MLPARAVLALMVAATAVAAQPNAFDIFKTSVGVVHVLEAEANTTAPVLIEPIDTAPVTVAPAVPAEPIADTPSVAPVTEAPVTDAPATEAPVTEAPLTEAPVTVAPDTEAPDTEAPATEAPVTEAPVTEGPVTEAPATEAPVTEGPVTTAPGTEAPATEAPVTEAPTTTVPASTDAPVTEAPVTTEPTTTEPPATTVPVTTEPPATTSPATTEPATTEPLATTAPPTTAPPLTPMCIEVINKDRVGFDFKNVPGKGFFDCQMPCSTTPGCVTFSWSDYEGGTCWLKNGLGQEINKAGVSTALCPSHGADKCTELKNQDRDGSDLTNVKGKFMDCAGHCKATKGCVTFSWSDYLGGTCWLKSTEAPIVVKQGVSTTGCIYGSPVPPPAPVCSVYKDIDFVGNDIANKPGKSADDCCGICDKHAGCTAYAWSDHNGGTCWLKKSVGHVIAKAGVTSGSTVKLFGPVCPFEYDVDFVGNDVGNKPAKDAGVCCDLCKKTNGCKAYTWSNFNGGTCWMKSGKGKVVAAAGKISAKLTDF